MTEEEVRHSAGDDDRDLEAMLDATLQRVAEAVIFAADEPVPLERIAAVFADVTGEPQPDDTAVGRAVDRLNALYQDTERTFRIEAWAGGLRLATVPSVAPFLKALHRRDLHRKLSRSLLETLAIVAYRQPVTKPEVDFIRGVDSDYSLRKLLEMGLVDVVGRSDSLGRPLLYGTTRHFLDQFGLNALDDLPNLREVEEILNDPAFNKERAQLLELDRIDASVSEDDEAEPAESVEVPEQVDSSDVEGAGSSDTAEQE